MKSVILADIGDVLVKGLEGSEVAIAKQLNSDVETISRDLYAYDFGPFWLGKIKEDDFLSKLIKEYKWKIAVNKLKGLIRENFYEIEETRQIYTLLGSQHSLIGMSVNSVEWSSFVEEKFVINKLFKRIYYSFDLGYTKRSPKSFIGVCNLLNVDPKEVLLIDDSSRNLSTAKEVGIVGIKFINPNQLINDLQKLNYL